jgi:hypothetical protein
MKLKAGDWVEVRSREEILGTLDENGRLDELPFMPQMFRYCGQRFQVYKRAHKTCDTVNLTGGRRIVDTVHLELRCDGKVYGGCQAECLIFWKIAWLRPLKKKSHGISILKAQKKQGTEEGLCSEADVYSGTYHSADGTDSERRYICQATQLPLFTTPLPWWDLRQYLEDFSSRNTTLSRMFKGLIFSCIFNLSQMGIGAGRPIRWLYDRVQALYGGTPYPRRKGTIAAGKPTPTRALDLQPGELVRVRSFKEILATLDTNSRNRGLSFDPEHVPFTGGTYYVRARVSTFIDEKSGRLMTLKNDCIILDGVWCQARYSYCRMFCPRSIYPWWREIWLERILGSTKAKADDENPSPASADCL